MARKLRIQFEGACYHIINRGNYRADVFANQGAAKAFETCLWEACEKTGWRLHAFIWEPPAPSAVGLGLTEQNSKSRGPTP